MNEESTDFLIVGGGLAGLSCALNLQEAGREAMILEAADEPGGRVRTDETKGYLLDRGFQVYLDAYPTAGALFNLPELNLGRFEPGAIIWDGKRLLPMVDPRRRPSTALRTLFGAPGSFGDKARVGMMAHQLGRSSVDALTSGEERRTADYLRARGFSEAFIRSFFTPFLGGIFLEHQLSSSSHMFAFVFKMFSTGAACLPAKGMGALPGQLAGRLRPGALKTGVVVTRVEPGRAELAGGGSIKAREIVLATDMETASALRPGLPKRPWNGTVCHYFCSPRIDSDLPVLRLNGSGEGKVSHLAVPSAVRETYAPEGFSLISVSMKPGEQATVEAVAREATQLLGTPDRDLQHLASYRIPHALPRQDPGDLAFKQDQWSCGDGLWVCGDHRVSSSIEGAVSSGVAVARALSATC